MRVITGTARGRRLQTPEGMDTRPTGEKVKEALFSAIQFEIQNKSVLDLFAGSGQLGIEALSRGASRCVFIDKDRAAADIVKMNTESTGFKSRSLISSMDAVMFLRYAKEEFDIIFLDPPYKKNIINDIEKDVERVINPRSIVVCETSAKEELPENYASLPLSFDRRYGETRLRIYRNAEKDIY